jgi:hypothetical protein
VVLHDLDARVEVHFGDCDDDAGLGRGREVGAAAPARADDGESGLALVL